MKRRRVRPSTTVPHPGAVSPPGPWGRLEAPWFVLACFACFAVVVQVLDHMHVAMYVVYGCTNMDYNVTSAY